MNSSSLKSAPPRLNLQLGYKLKVLLMINAPALLAMAIVAYYYMKGTIQFRELPDGVLESLSLTFLAAGLLTVFAWVITPLLRFFYRYSLHYVQQGIAGAIIFLLPLFIAGVAFITSAIAVMILTLASFGFFLLTVILLLKKM